MRTKHPPGAERHGPVAGMHEAPRTTATPLAGMSTG